MKTAAGNTSKCLPTTVYLALPAARHQPFLGRTLCTFGWYGVDTVGFLFLAIWQEAFRKPLVRGIFNYLWLLSCKVTTG